MKPLLFLSSILLFSVTSVFAKDDRLTKEEFLSRVENGTITLERAPVMSLPAPIADKVQEKIREKYPRFKDELWYVHYITDNSYMYSLFFDWTLDQCSLRIEKIDPKLKKPNERTMDTVGQRVKKSYCDKVYMINI
jgi:hypothetical protein